jgi:hypothetical protein
MAVANVCDKTARLPFPPPAEAPPNEAIIHLAI